MVLWSDVARGTVRRRGHLSPYNVLIYRIRIRIRIGGWSGSLSPFAALLSPREFAAERCMERLIECALAFDARADVVTQPATTKPSLLRNLPDRVRRNELRIIRWFGLDRFVVSGEALLHAILLSKVALLSLGKTVGSELFEHGNTIPFQG